MPHNSFVTFPRPSPWKICINNVAFNQSMMMRAANYDTYWKNKGLYGDLGRQQHKSGKNLLIMVMKIIMYSKLRVYLTLTAQNWQNLKKKKDYSSYIFYDIAMKFIR